jgi:hypothetical protein
MLSNYNPNSPVFIYQSLENLNQENIKYINQNFNIFFKNWHSHNNPIQANIVILHEHILVIIIDGIDSISGCSKDTLTKFVKEIGLHLNRSFFNRTHIPYIHKLDFDDDIESDSPIQFIAYKNMISIDVNSHSLNSQSINDLDCIIILDTSSVKVGAIYLTLKDWFSKFKL